jgi:hypothetical protein
MKKFIKRSIVAFWRSDGLSFVDGTTSTTHIKKVTVPIVKRQLYRIILNSSGSIDEFKALKSLFYRL